MNNLVQSYKIILEKLTENCSHIKSYSQVRHSKLFDIKLAVLNITTGQVLYDFELQLFMYIKNQTHHTVSAINYVWLPREYCDSAGINTI